jgi:hypothetical protein
MKPSHLTTPRTLDECYFDPRGQAIETMPKKHKSLWAIIIGLFLPQK